MTHPIHAILSDAAELLAAVLPEDARVATVTLTPDTRYRPLSVQVDEASFRRAAAGLTVEADRWETRDGEWRTTLSATVGGVYLYSGTREVLSGAVVLDSEGRTVLADGEGRVA